MKKTLGILVLVLVGCAVPAARGDLSYELVAEQADYDVALGSTVDVRIFLRETATDGDASQLVGPGGGLISAGVRLLFDDSGAARVISVGDVFENPAFTSVASLLKEVAAGSAGLAEDVDLFDPPVEATAASPGVALLELGVFRFTALSAGVAVVTIEDFDASQVNFLTAGFVNLDEAPSAVRSSTFTITVARPGVIPEPASLVLAGSGLLGLGVWGGVRRSRGS